MTQNPARPDSPDGPDWDAVGRHLSGESSAEESAVVRRQLEGSPEDAAFVDALARADRLPRAAEVDVEAALRRVRERLDEPEVLPLRPRAFPWRRAPAWGLAAAAAAVLMVGGFLMRNPSRERAATRVAQSLRTGVGVRDSVRLSDGTLVVLGPVSSLEVLPGFGSAQRQVTLSGEGYFEVTHDEAMPFIVHAGDAAIRDVGTRFVVRVGDGRTSATRVAVTEGAVSLKSTRPASDTGILLNAGDVGTLLPDGRTFAQRGVARESDAAWTRGTLLFRDAAMTEVREELRRWYGVEILVDSAIAGRHLTATFSNEPIDRVLEIIALTLGARIDQQGDTVVVRPAAGTTRR